MSTLSHLLLLVSPSCTSIKSNADLQPGNTTSSSQEFKSSLSFSPTSSSSKLGAVPSKKPVYYMMARKLSRELQILLREIWRYLEVRRRRKNLWNIVMAMTGGLFNRYTLSFQIYAIFCCAIVMLLASLELHVMARR